MGRLIDKFGKGLSEISYIKDDSFRVFIVSLFRNEMLKRTNSFPDEVQRFVKNVMASQYRGFLALMKLRKIKIPLS